MKAIDSFSSRKSVSHFKRLLRPTRKEIDEKFIFLYLIECINRITVMNLASVVACFLSLNLNPVFTC